MGYFGTFVIPATLATPTDLAAWTGTAAPSNATQLLRSCTTMVLSATEGAFYDVDPLTGLATDAQILAGMRDATCIQAAAWAALGIDPLTGGAVTSKVKSSQKLLTASITYADSTEAAAARKAAYESLVPQALQKLQQLNLLSWTPWTR